MIAFNHSLRSNSMIKGTLIILVLCPLYAFILKGKYHDRVASIFLLSLTKSTC